MKKLLTLLLLFFLTIITSISLLAQGTLNTLVVNYYRYNDVDKLHTSWIWQHLPNGGEGKEFSFVKEGDSNWLTMNVDLTAPAYAGSSHLGIIIKEGKGWNGPRQPGGDRYIDLSKIKNTSGVGHVYFVQEEVNIFYSLEDADVSDKILDVYFETNKRITVTATSIANKATLYEDGVNIFEHTNISTYKFTFNPSKFDISKKYEVELDFAGGKSKKLVSLRNLYSTAEFEEYFHYDGELGLIYSKKESTFRLWSPVSEEVTLNIYNQGHPRFDSNGFLNEESEPQKTHSMTNIGKGVWEVVVSGDLAGKYYTFSMKQGTVISEIVDPYAYSTGANGLRALVIDFSKTNPKGWKYDSRPQTIENITDYIIYELHVRDLTTHKSWEGTEEYRGTFMGVAESGTTYTKDGITVTTGLDHLAELGVNAVHFLPIFDFGYVDETRFDDEVYMSSYGFNWGYMPYNFNTPEGSFSTNPFDGFTRVKELKTMIQALHNKNIRVIMDVVYNHTGETEGSQFEKSMPGYYFRMNADGSYSNGSGTGNETASENSMFRKYMIDSILFWAKEYNISGFRFDLMALHDVETMNKIREAVNEIDPTIILYGEPWMGGSSPLSGEERTDKNNLHKLNNVAAFNDNTRDAIKKNWNTKNTEGQILNSIRYGISGATPMNDAWAQGDHQSFHGEPAKVINYVSAHDDETLRDYNYNFNGARGDDLIKLQKQSNAFILTSQGIPFLHAGVDFMRSKPVPDHVEATPDNRVVNKTSGNSYNLPDVVNQLNWEDKIKYYEVFDFYRHLIAIRRILPNLRLHSADKVSNKLTFENVGNNNQITYRIKGDNETPEIVVVHTNNSFGSFVADKNYIRLINKLGQADAHGISKVSAGTTLDIDNYSTLILVEDNEELFNYNPGAEPYYFGTPTHTTGEPKTVSLGLILGITIPVLLVGVGVVVFFILKKKK